MHKLFLLLLPLLFLGCSPAKWVEYQADGVSISVRPSESGTSFCPSETQVKAELALQKRFMNDMMTNYGLKSAKSLKIFLYPAELAQKEIGTTTGGRTDNDGTIHYVAFEPTQELVYGEMSLLGFHETVHSLQIASLGKPTRSRVLGEGLASGLDRGYGVRTIKGQQQRNPIRDIFHQIKGSDQVLSLKQLFGNEALDEGRFYPQAGLFCQWLLQKYGFETYAKLYQASANDEKLDLLADAPNWAGMTPEQLQAAYRAWQNTL